MELRPYQEECIQVVNALPDGSRSVAVLATGLGKTVIASHFAFRGRMLWLSHRDELVRQPERYFTEQGYSFGIEKAEDYAQDEDVVSASVQSLYRDARLQRYAPDAFDLIIVDEAQHAAAASYLKILHYFKPRKLIGLTATPRRGDRVGLSEAFDTICFTRDLRWGIENGYLSRLRCLKVEADFDMKDIEKAMGDYSQESLQKAMLDSNNDIVVTKAYLEHCLPENRKTLIYCPSLKVCDLVADTLRKALQPAERETIAVLSEKVPTEERRGILAAYREGTIRCIINCMILTEGADLPDTSAIINDRPTANDSLYLQMIGRGTRLAEGKEYCLIIDVLGEDSKGHDLCTAPTLFGIDPLRLPKEVQKKLEEGDLLDIATAVGKERAKAVEQVELRSYMVDIFTQERVGAINESKTYADVAAAARTFLEQASGEDYDFGDILVKRMPDDAHYWCIPATYHGRIYLSKPDLLGKTIMEFSEVETTLPDYPILQMTSDPLPLEEAVTFLKDFLRYAVPDQYRRKWSKEGRKELEAFPITDRQYSFVVQDLLWGKTGKADTLNRLQASDIIDLCLEVKELEKEKKEYDLDAADRSKKRRGKILEKWLSKKEAEEAVKEEEVQKARQTYRESIESIRNSLEDRKNGRRGRVGQEGKAGQERIEGQKGIEGQEGKVYSETEPSPTSADYPWLSWIPGHTEEYSLPLSANWYTKTKNPSDKQLSFALSLLKKAKDAGATFDQDPSPLSLILDMWHTGFYINYLKDIVENRTYPGLQLQFELSHFLEEIEKIKKPEDCPKEVTCGFTVVKGAT